MGGHFFNRQVLVFLYFYID